MKNSEVLQAVGKLLYPFIVLFGFYIIFHGDVSPGGGFQGGTILATAFLAVYIIKSQNIFKIDFLIKSEKIIFLILLFAAFFSYFTRGVMFTNFFDSGSGANIRRLFLVLLNVLIGLKVAYGLIAVFTSFIYEGASLMDSSDNDSEHVKENIKSD